jgi:hypothetical protein
MNKGNRYRTGGVTMALLGLVFMTFLGLVGCYDGSSPQNLNGYEVRSTADGVSASSRFVLTLNGKTYNMQDQIDIHYARDPGDADQVNLAVSEEGQGQPVNFSVVDERGAASLTSQGGTLNVTRPSDVYYEYNGTRYYSPETLGMALRNDPAIRAMSEQSQAAFVASGESAEALANDPAAAGHRARVGRAIASAFRFVFSIFSVGCHWDSQGRRCYAGTR